MRTGTTVDETDSNFIKDEDTFGFGNLSNFNLTNLTAGGIAAEGTAKEIESIDINNILGLEIFPTLIVLFCMTQSLPMETKILNLLTRFYNQRFEFA
jgi:hypothetical protein